jgi:hypothetical protein
MVALLSAHHPHHPGLAPPDTVSWGTLAEALDAALSRRRQPGPNRPLPVMDVAAVRDAVEALPRSALDLLAILGPDACAEDPTLALRLASSLTRLPALNPQIHRMLDRRALTGSAAPTQRVASTSAGAGRAGEPLLTRHGDPRHLISTHLALPPEPRAVLAATGGLLYRRGSAEPRRRPVDRTLVLDTSPATFGPVEIVLRLVTHLVTNALWQAGARVALLVAEHPDRPIELETSRDLLRVWNSRTLNRTDPAALVRAATDHGRPVVVLTHYESAARAGLLGRDGPGLVLLTSHTPPARPPHPTGAGHHHLAAPATAEEVETVTRLLIDAAP